MGRNEKISGCLFFPYSSRDVCHQSAGSAHPFRTRVFLSSPESNRIRREANPLKHLSLQRWHPSSDCKPSTSMLVSLQQHLQRELQDSTLLQARSKHPEIGLRSCSPALRAAAGGHGQAWYLIPADMTRISRQHLLSVHVSNVSPLAPQAGDLPRASTALSRSLPLPGAVWQSKQWSAETPLLPGA